MKSRPYYLSSLESSFLSTVKSAATTVVGQASRVLEDPALPEVTSLLSELHRVSASGKASVATAGPSVGVGLGRIVTPLKLVIQVKRHPWIVPVAIGLVFMVPFALGVAVGRKRR